jgi:hypothetical protein
MGLKPRRAPSPVAAIRDSPAGSAAGVDAYIRALPDESRAIAAELRGAVVRAVPGVVERIKWNVPVFELETPVCYLWAHPRHVRLGFYRGTELADPRGLLQGTGVRLRHVKVGLDAPVPRAQLEELVRQAADLARVGQSS